MARSYSYDPYGNRAASGGSGWDDTIGYVGGVETSTGLVHFGARLLDPAAGRWTQMDPLGSNAEALTHSPFGALTQDYLYAGDDPINFIDPSGLRDNAPPPPINLQPYCTPFAQKYIPGRAAWCAKSYASLYGGTRFEKWFQLRT